MIASQPYSHTLGASVSYDLWAGEFIGIDDAVMNVLVKAFPTVDVPNCLVLASLQLLTEPKKRERGALAHIQTVLREAEAREAKARQKQDAIDQKKAIKALAASRKACTNATVSPFMRGLIFGAAPAA